MKNMSLESKIANFQWKLDVPLASKKLIINELIIQWIKNNSLIIND